MKKLNKKILITTLLLTLFLLTISTATAADIHMNTTNNTIANAVENQTINDDTIYLDEGTYDYLHLNGTEGIIIDKNITIIGKGADKTIIDAQQQGRIFNIGSSGILTLINITLTNGTNTQGGAIINYYGSLTVTGSSFTDNTATTWDGGAIYNGDDGSVNVTDSTFNNNTANDWGGVIINYGSLTVADSSFTDNTATNRGGAIYNYGNLTVTGSSFTDNTATNRGGAIYNYDGSMNVTGCDFINNNNTIHNHGGDLIVNYNRFVNNTGNYDINYAPISMSSFDINYNWWGNNTPDMSKIIGIVPNNYFIMNVTNLTSLDSNGTVTFQYTFKLNNTDSFNATLLPYFLTEVYTNITTGIVNSFDARFDNSFDVTVNTNGKILYTFVTDNEIQNLEGNAVIPIPPEPPEPTPTPDPVDPVDPADPVDPDTPNTPQPTNNETSNNPTAKAVMKETGIPINLILLVLLSVLGVLVSKKQ